MRWKQRPTGANRLRHSGARATCGSPNNRATTANTRTGLQDTKSGFSNKRSFCSSSQYPPRCKGSGTYFEYDGHHIIITAAHVVAEGGDVMMITSPTGEDIPALLIYYDNRDPNDTAVLVLRSPLETRTPMELDLYSKDPNNLIGEQTVYTGDPGHQRNMTIYGTVSSINENGSVMLQSYAWGGASGSIVFDDRGRIIGILKAIDVNRSGVSPYPQINENVVWLSPPSSLDLDILSDTLLEYSRVMEIILGGTE